MPKSRDCPGLKIDFRSGHVLSLTTMARIEEIHEEEVPPPKVNNASLGELKATSDDAIAPVWLFLDC
jgi:hypothetical protein